MDIQAIYGKAQQDRAVDTVRILVKNRLTAPGQSVTIGIVRIEQSRNAQLTKGEGHPPAQICNHRAEPACSVPGQSREYGTELTSASLDCKALPCHSTDGPLQMKFGAAIFFTDYSISPVDLARALEERGFESLWCPEHSHIPLSRSSAWPQQGELPKKYYDVMDPFVTLAQAAAVTTRLKLGTGICLVVQRDPIQTAKEVATLDSVSGGRFLFGIGAGWNADEMANHGTVFKGRHKVMRERVEAMRVIWREDKAEYHGEHVKFGPMSTWPKPVQSPGPPVLIGGEFPYGARRALAYGDGWLPHAKRPDYNLLDKLPNFRQMEAEAGRDPGSTPISAFGPDEDLATCERYAEAGVERIIYNLPPDGPGSVLPLLDCWTRVIERMS